MHINVKKWLGMATLLVTTSSQAAVNVSFERDVELLAINGKELGLLSSALSQVELTDGPNQLITRVSKLVSYHGEFKKFQTKPVVLTFNASDADIHVSASRVIIREDQIKGFDDNPSFKLEMNGSLFSDYHQDVLLRGSGIVRDYERELEAYNVDQGFVAETKVLPNLNYVSAAAIGTATINSVSEAPPKKSLSSEQAFILLQADYLRLTADQQQAFLSWAQSQK